MKPSSWLDLGEYTIDDEYPPIYFVFTEKTFNLTNRRFQIVDLDPTDYTNIKFCARHEDNNSDFDDHSLDDIYANMVSDGAGVYHYTPAADAIDKPGRWAVRIEFEKTTNAKFHAPFVWFFHAVHKMPGKFGDR